MFEVHVLGVGDEAGRGAQFVHQGRHFGIGRQAPPQTLRHNAGCLRLAVAIGLNIRSRAFRLAQHAVLPGDRLPRARAARTGR